MKYEDKLFISKWRYKVRIGKLLIRFSLVGKADISEYIFTMIIGLFYILILPFALIRLIWISRPKLFWFKGTNKELDIILEDVSNQRNGKNVENFINSV